MGARWGEAGAVGHETLDEGQCDHLAAALQLGATHEYDRRYDHAGHGLDAPIGRSALVYAQGHVCGEAERLDARAAKPLGVVVDNGNIPLLAAWHAYGLAGGISPRNRLCLRGLRSHIFAYGSA